MEILDQATLIGDKVVVFSQSLISLDVIEHFLKEITEEREAGRRLRLYGVPCRW